MTGPECPPARIGRADAVAAAPMVAMPRVIDLGRMSYAEAYGLQTAHHEEVLAARDRANFRGGGAAGPVEWGRILLVEHDPPVITVSRRQNARDHLVATSEQLQLAGVEVAETDRGGDITYHGPGQLVVYPILDLNLYHLGLHAYMRLLEQAIIDAISEFGIRGLRDPSATGVWVDPLSGDGSGDSHHAPDLQHSAKIAALGVRVRRWVSMHGLAVNVTTNLNHFRLIVPCGLVGRPVTSMLQVLGERCPGMPRVKECLAANLSRLLAAAYAARPAPGNA